MSTFSTSKPGFTTSWTRTSMIKVKSGCVTCRYRRVKCDETKPFCRRCLKYGGPGFCNGYESSKTNASQKAKPDAKIRYLIPYGPSSQTPSLNLFSEREWPFYQLFCNQTAFKLSVYFRSASHHRLILQACQNEPFIRSALIAIAALDRSMTMANDARKAPRSPLEQPSATDCYQFALQYYGNSLTQIRQAMAAGERHLRAALISCLLTVTFENWSGRHDSALSQLLSGLKLIHNWLRTNNYRGTTSPAPSIVEDDLVYAFSRFDIWVMTFIDLRYVQVHGSAQVDPNAIDGPLQLPIRFTTFEQARIHWTNLFRRMCYLSTTMEKSQILSEGLSSCHVRWSHRQTNSGNLPDTILSERDKFMVQVTDWYRAFEPLLQCSDIFPSSKDHFRINLLHVGVHVSRIAFASSFFASEVEYDGHFSEFSAIVSGWRLLLERYAWKGSRSSTEPIYFDIGQRSSLFMVAIKCRDRILRRQALALIESTTRNNGVSDSAMTAELARWIIDVEEEGDEQCPGVASGLIPPDSRAWISNVEVNMMDKTIVLQCAQRKKVDGTYKLIFRETTKSWK